MMKNHINQTQREMLEKLDNISNIKNNDKAIYKFIHFLMANPSLSDIKSELGETGKRVELMRKYNAKRYLQFPTIKDRPTKNCLKQMRQIKGDYVLLIVEEEDPILILEDGTINEPNYLTIKPVSRSYINKIIKVTRNTIINKDPQNLNSFRQSYSYNSICHALMDVGFNLNKYHQNPYANYLVSNLYNINPSQKKNFKIETIEQAYNDLSDEEIYIMKDMDNQDVATEIEDNEYLQDMTGRNDATPNYNYSAQNQYDNDEEELRDSFYDRLIINRASLGVPLGTDISKRLICIINDDFSLLNVKSLINTQYLTYENGSHMALQQLIYNSLFQTITGRIKLLLKSNISTKDIAKYTGINSFVIDKLRNGSYQLNRLHLGLAEKLDSFIRRYTIDANLKSDGSSPIMEMKSMHY